MKFLTFPVGLWYLFFYLRVSVFVGHKRKMKEKVDSPVTVLEDYFRSSDSESSSSKEPSADSESQELSKPASRWHSFIQLLRSGSKKQMNNTLHPLSVLKLSKRMSTSMRESILPSCLLDATASPCRSPWKIFTHHEIQVATNSFSQGMQRASE